jgi:hypothetical protein
LIYKVHVCHARVEAFVGCWGPMTRFFCDSQRIAGEMSHRAAFFMVVMGVVRSILFKRTRVNVGIERGWWMIVIPV